MEQRPTEGLLANLWQFPMIEHGKDSIDTFKIEYSLDVQSQKNLLTFKHVFSHLTWHLNSYFMICHSTEKGVWLTREQIEQLPMPVPMLKIWREMEN